MGWGAIGYFARGKTLREFEEMLQMNNGRGLNAWLRGNAVAGAVVFLLVLCALIYAGADEFYITTIPLAASAAPFLAGYFMQHYRFEQRKRAIEGFVPDLLLQASVFPAGTSMISIIKYLGSANYGELSSEFARAHSEIEKGAPVEAALLNIKKRNRSAILDRAINLLVQGYNSGADMGRIFKEAAEDLLETNSIIRERVASMVVEKYTLLFAGGIIVPLVLGLIVGLVSGLEFGNLGELGIGMPTAERKEMLGAALFANQVYIGEYAILASLFIANQESNIKKAVVYAAVLLPLSLLVYNLAQVF